MRRRKLVQAIRTFALTVLFICPQLTPLAQAQSKPLMYLSKDAAAVVRIREPDQTVEKIATMINGIQPGVGDLFHEQYQKVLPKLISVPDLRGVDLSRDWFIASYAIRDAAPNVVFVIPAIRADELAASLPRSFTKQIHGNYVVYSPAATLPVVEDSLSLGAVIAEDAKTRLMTGDLSLYLNAQILHSVYQAQVEMGEAGLKSGLNSLRYMEPEGGVNFEGLADFYSGIMSSAFNVLKDTDIVSTSITYEKDVFSADTIVKFQGKAEEVKWLTSKPQSELGDLTLLPTNQMLYFGASGFNKDLMHYGIKSSGRMLRLGDNYEARADALLKDLDQLDFQDLTNSVNYVESSSGGLRIAGISRVSPVPEYLKFFEKSVVTMGDISTPAFKQKAKYQLNAEKIGNQNISILSMQQDINPDDPGSEKLQQINTMLYGAEGMRQRITGVGENAVVITIGGGRTLMREVINNVESSKTNSLASLRKTIAPKANLIMFTDVPGALGFVLKMASQMNPEVIKVDSRAIDTLLQRPSYTAVSARGEDNSLKLEFRLPVDQINGMVRLGVLAGSSMTGATPGFVPVK